MAEKITLHYSLKDIRKLCQEEGHTRGLAIRSLFSYYWGILPFFWCAPYSTSILIDGCHHHNISNWINRPGLCAMLSSMPAYSHTSLKNCSNQMCSVCSTLNNNGQQNRSPGSTPARYLFHSLFCTPQLYWEEAATLSHCLSLLISAKGAISTPLVSCLAMPPSLMPSSSEWHRNAPLLLAP